MQDHKPVHHKAPISSKDLPPIPEKRYFTIGEVAKLCAVKPHVLRYWEQEFPQLKPSKRRGNRRYYQFKDVKMIRIIYHLLYDKGFTISGARQHIKQSGSKEMGSIPLTTTATNQTIEASREVSGASMPSTSVDTPTWQTPEPEQQTPLSQPQRRLSGVNLAPIIEELESVLDDLERVAF